MRDFRKIKVWEKSHYLVLEIYEITKDFPKDEIFGITNQIRRAVVSIPNNLAEGCGRNSEKELKQFSVISMGSASEVEYLLFLSFELKYLSKENYDFLNDRIIEIKKMLAGFIVSLTR